MNILITGGAGFIGSNFVHYMLDKHRGYNIVNLDLLTYAGNLANLKGVEENRNYTFIKGHIANKDLVDYLVKYYEVEAIINFAAESHVDRSITDPDVFISSNVAGTQALLEVYKKNRNQVNKFVQISTDEVYGSLGKMGYFTENTPLAPNSPYSASKAAADLIAKSYFETFGLNINITRCSNNYGPYHFPEKLIPLIITNALEDKKLPVYGTGDNVRDWLHVEDHCSAIDLVLHEGKAGEIYNIGGHNERKNIEIVELIVDKLGKSRELIAFVEDRLGHDKRYAIDPTKIKMELGWQPQFTFNKGIEETINWYINHKNWWQTIKNGEYLSYYERQYKTGS